MKNLSVYFLKEAIVLYNNSTITKFRNFNIGVILLSNPESRLNFINSPSNFLYNYIFQIEGLIQDLRLHLIVCF